MPFVVRAGDHEIVEPIAVADSQALSRVSEPENDFLAGNLCFAKHRARSRYLMLIHISQRPASHSLTDLEFIFRMDVVGYTDVDGHDQTGVRVIERDAPLRLAQMAPGLVRRLRLCITVVG